MDTNCTTLNNTDGNTTCGNVDSSDGSSVFLPVVNIITYSVVYGVIFLMALSGNLLVCFVIVKNPDMRTVTNSFLLNLAVSDILFTLVTVPPLVATEVSYKWIFGEFMCKAVPVVSMTTTSVSIYTMVILAVDRYYAIVKPFEARAHHTIKRTLAIIFVTWLLSFAIAIPQATARVIHRTPSYEYCDESWTDQGGPLGAQTYTAITFALLFVVPISVITVSYVGIMRRLWNREEVLATACNMGKVNHTEARNNGAAAKSVEQTRLSRNKRKTTFMLLVVIVVFLVCNSPFNILLLVTAFLDREDMHESLYVTASILAVLAVSSSACNPFIYNFFSEKFRRAYHSVFTCGRDHNEDDLPLSTVLNLR